MEHHQTLKEIPLKIIDVVGKTVFEENSNESKSLRINIAKLKSGVYHLMIYTNHILYETKPIIKY